MIGNREGLFVLPPCLETQNDAWEPRASILRGPQVFHACAGIQCKVANDRFSILERSSPIYQSGDRDGAKLHELLIVIGVSMLSELPDLLSATSAISVSLLEFAATSDVNAGKSSPPRQKAR